MRLTCTRGKIGRLRGRIGTAGRHVHRQRRPQPTAGIRRNAARHETSATLVNPPFPDVGGTGPLAGLFRNRDSRKPASWKRLNHSPANPHV